MNDLLVCMLIGAGLAAISIAAIPYGVAGVLALLRLRRERSWRYHPVPPPPEGFSDRLLAAGVTAAEAKAGLMAFGPCPSREPSWQTLPQVAAWSGPTMTRAAVVTWDQGIECTARPDGSIHLSVRK